MSDILSETPDPDYPGLSGVFAKDLSARMSQLEGKSQKVCDEHIMTEKKLKKLGILVGIIATLGPTVVASSVWAFTKAGDMREEALQKEQTKQRIEHLNGRLDSFEIKTDHDLYNIKENLVEQQILIVDSVDHITKKIDSIGSGGGSVQEPKSLTRAREETKREKARKFLD
jgi:hypothetical protein